MEAGIALAAVTAGGSILKGIGQKQQADSEASAMKAGARAADTRALQRDAFARDELDRTIGSIRAARSANGLNLNSPTALALLDEANEVMSQERLTAVSNERAEAASLRASAKARRRAGKFALAGGFMRAGTTLGQAYADS